MKSVNKGKTSHSLARKRRKAGGGRGSFVFRRGIAFFAVPRKEGVFPNTLGKQ